MCCWNFPFPCHIVFVLTAFIPAEWTNRFKVWTNAHTPKNNHQILRIWCCKTSGIIFYWLIIVSSSGCWDFLDRFYLTFAVCKFLFGFLFHAKINLSSEQDKLCKYMLKSSRCLLVSKRPLGYWGKTMNKLQKWFKDQVKAQTSI